MNIDQYLNEVSYKKISEEQQKEINRDITKEEIITAIKQLKVGKTPGTDGLTAVYYKILADELVEPLKDLFNNILNEGVVPQSWSTAFISLIPKEEQDLSKPKNYRPISLLNTDYTIFAKIWANRLMHILTQIVHTDQTGFITGRYMKNNVRHVVDLIEYLDKNSQIPAALIFLDAEKAFDQLNWDFLMKLVDKLDFGAKFKTSLKAIYKQQTAQIIINGELTEPFEIHKGTRQGCPLSPLLFVLSMEVLLIKIRELKKIKGIQVRENQYKLKAFADDLVLTVTESEESISELMKIILDYGRVSGFKVNKNKTKMLVMNMIKEEQEDIKLITGFEIVEKVKYLGVYLTNANIQLYKNNYEKVWYQIQKDFVSWRKLKLSILGRIAIIKMNVLPRFLFFFQVIPILKRDSNLDEWQRGANKFIWDGKKPRVKLKIIQDVKERGGL